MTKQDTIADIIFPESINFKTDDKYTDEKYISKKLDDLTKGFRAIRGNWHTLNPYLQLMFKIVKENETQQAILRWIEDNGEL